MLVGPVAVNAANDCDFEDGWMKKPAVAVDLGSSSCADCEVEENVVRACDYTSDLDSLAYLDCD